MLDGRRVFIGNNGHCGLVPDRTETGVLICVLFGCDVPVVLRQKAGRYIFIGECYVRGLMHGEAIETLKQGNAEEERFEIFYTCPKTDKERYIFKEFFQQYNSYLRFRIEAAWNGAKSVSCVYTAEYTVTRSSGKVVVNYQSIVCLGYESTYHGHHDN
ncbi:hypothetical protein BGZ60DRAFT_37163 [Tricladium varicosporioides]|nr:hypothetical protein BGZ60DRAFT_37163 [Hymenoscyphus varicosporioides]